jgi:hypothetical protein
MSEADRIVEQLAAIDDPLSDAGGDSRHDRENSRRKGCYRR